MNKRREEKGYLKEACSNPPPPGTCAHGAARAEPPVGVTAAGSRTQQPAGLAICLPQLHSAVPNDNPRQRTTSEISHQAVSSLLA